jgi:hypothetical protein
MGDVRGQTAKRSISGKRSRAPARIAPKIALSSFSISLWTLLRNGLAWNGELIADAYAAAAGIVQERKEALEDLNAERNYRRKHPVVLTGNAGSSVRRSSLSASVADGSE